MVRHAKRGWLSRLCQAFSGPAFDIEALEAEYPSEEDLRDDPDFNRHQATKIAVRLVDGDRASRDAAIEISKWLLTSLLALNAGGMVATSQFDLPGTLRFIAGVLFLLGVGLPLFSGHLSIKAWVELSSLMGRQIGYWEAVEHNGFRIRETELDLLEVVALARAKMRMPYVLGYLAMLSFISGALVLGAGILLA